MNTTNLEKEVDQSKQMVIRHARCLEKLLPRQNGTPAGVAALAASLQRGNAYVEAQQRINDLCNPVQTQLSNTLTQEA